MKRVTIFCFESTFLTTERRNDGTTERLNGGSDDDDDFSDSKTKIN
jgi:hypothetical protein